MSFFLATLLLSAARTHLAVNITTTTHLVVAQGWGGGWCLASMAAAGWTRAGIINPAVSTGVNTLPPLTASNSGGSMFATRFFVYREHATATRWNYPCYLLHNPYLKVCYFHGRFGAISDECYTEIFNVVAGATNVIYGSIFMSYGGPLGVAAIYAFTYFPFLSDLPIAVSDKNFHSFASKYVIGDTGANWLCTHTIVTPPTNAPYNYGFGSYMSRSTGAQNYREDGWTPTTVNMSVNWVVSASANMQSGFVMFPLSFAGKSWDPSNEVALSSSLKLVSLTISFLMVKKLMAAHTLMHLEYGNKNDPVMDGAYTDNAPLTPIVSAGSKMSTERPGWIISVGAASTMATVKYLMGAGPLDIWIFGGVNVCPFTIGGLCTILSQIRTLSAGTMTQKSQQAYFSLDNAFGVWRPEIKLLIPFCGDPLTYDIFAGRCSADSVCDMLSTVIPSTVNNVAFTADVYSLVFVMTFLQATPVSRRFAEMFLPREMWELEYYEHMGNWFPDFDALAPGKGGMGFTNLAGNSFLDFMTYLNIRLSGYIESTKTLAGKLHSGGHQECNFNKYESTREETMTESEFTGQMTR